MEKDAVAAAKEWEHNALKNLLASFAEIDPLSQGVAELVFADGPQARAEVVRRYPELVGERGEASLEILVSFAVMTGLVTTLPRLQELQGWLRDHGKPQAPPAAPG